MIFKTIGLILLSFTAVYIGFSMGRNEKKRQRDLVFLTGLIGHIRREIAFDRTELPSCFRSYRQRNDHPALPYFESGNNKRALELLSVKKDQKELLYAFFDSLGKGNAEEECARCEKILDLLEEEEKKCGKDLPGKLRVSRTLGICIGAVILLLFL